MDESPVPFKQYFPNLSLNSYFWLVIGISAIVFGVGGYFVGIRVNQLPQYNQSQPTTVQQSILGPTPTIPGDDGDTDFSTIGGNFITDTDYYDQLTISIDSIKDGVHTNLDTDFRDITKPQVNVSYPYLFQRLDPSKSYVVSASACTTNPKTYALICAKNIKITKCTGKIDGKTCIISGAANHRINSGQVNFSIAKADNSVPSEN
ncbi:MAG TPA: hypothetical protein VLF93_05250 [Candidatus Saccharimonadales bacterium]|nr:hypothetical protein [Candidatus Saccharimonadales bacterium]